jgi:hypothetical protein
MSHVSTIQVEIKSLSALKEACRRLGFEFREQKTFTKWGISGDCDHAIHIPKAGFEVGIVKNGEQYNLLYDDYQTGGLDVALGPNAEKLIQAYAVEAAREEAQRQGYSVYEEARQDGSIELHIQVEGSV